MTAGAISVWELTILVWFGSAVAGLVGSLTGLGGGVVLVPLLTLFFKVDIRYAIGASLVSVIATSSGAAAAYVKEGISNIRIGMFLEIATTLGAVLGAFLAAKVSTSAIAIIFGAVLLYSAYLSARVRVRLKSDEIPDLLATRLRLNGSFPTPEGIRRYFVRRVPAWQPVAGTGPLDGGPRAAEAHERAGLSARRGAVRQEALPQGADVLHPSLRELSERPAGRLLP